MVQLHPSRLQYIGGEFDKPYMQGIKQYLLDEKKQGKVVYPAGANIFKACDLTPWDDVKVVILGQDPYHGVGQAMGLSFSVPEWVALPPSLVNIFKELEMEGQVAPFVDNKSPLPPFDKGGQKRSGDLTRWATQGVLLLNAILTVRAGEAASHSQIGWQQFTDTVIRILSEQREGIIFLLWGAYAQSKSSLIDTTKHHILTAPHPSPLSAYRGWFGCGHFRRANELLGQMGREKIVW